MRDSGIVLVLVLALVRNHRSFVDTAPISEDRKNDASTAKDSSVKELENLKHSLGKTLEIMKSQSSQYTSINGQQEGQTATKSEVSEDGKLLARIGQNVYSESSAGGQPTTKIRTDVDIPSQGIHKSVVQQLPGDYQTMTGNGHRRSTSLELPFASDNQNSVDKMDNLASIQYSPLYMAEYVFWTGDEKGVSLAIEEFLQEGLMSREEAISFLQEIKYNLEYLKSHYNQLGLSPRDRSKDIDMSGQQQQQQEQKQQQQPRTGLKNRLSYDNKQELRTNFDINQLRQEANKKRTSVSALPVLRPSAEKAPENDYDELLERLRVADFLYTEYSLEEVIYQLAKVMFTQSLTRGSSDAQQALQKFTNFLEEEAEQGRISRSLEKKVLDVLIAALSDTVAEHPELLAGARDTLQLPENQQHYIRQVLDLGPEEKLTIREFPYQTQHGAGSPSKSAGGSGGGGGGGVAGTNHVPLGLGKYKTP